jgi:hypothetical protein
MSTGKQTTGPLADFGDLNGVVLTGSPQEPTQAEATHDQGDDLETAPAPRA